MSAPSMTLSTLVIADWERLKRSAKAMGLNLYLDPKRNVFIIVEDANKRVVTSNLSDLAAVGRMLRMYHRMAVRYGDLSGVVTT